MMKGNQGTRGWFYIHPFLWAAQPIFFLYTRAIHEIRLIEVLVPLGVTLIGAVVFWALAYLALRRDLLKSACVTSLFVILFFSFGRVVNLADRFFGDTGLWRNLSRMQLPTRTASLQAAVLAVFGILLLAALVRLFLKKALSPWVTPLLARAAAVLLLLSMGQIAAALISAPRRAAPPQTAASDASLPPGNSPDVYIVAVDGYARDDVLREFYGFDNAPFLGALKELGFSIASKSSANYAWTFLSLASALNMTHLMDLAEKAGPRSRDQKRAQEMVRDNAVLAFMKSWGYRTVHLASAWAGTRSNPNADETVGGRRHIMDDDFTRTLADSSLLTLFNSRLVKDMAQFYLEQFKNLESMSAKPGPKMVFAHFLLPHPPYLFDRNGRILLDGSFIDYLLFRKAQWYKTDAYAEQVAFLNDRLLSVFRSIIRSSRVPPVIILISDHGPLVAHRDTEAGKRARLANLTAAYLPGAPAGILPEDVRLVNVFPIILNHYFGAGLELQAATRFFSSYSRPFSLESVGPDADFVGSGTSENGAGRTRPPSLEQPGLEPRRKRR